MRPMKILHAPNLTEMCLELFSQDRRYKTSKPDFECDGLFYERWKEDLFVG